jgi:Domain of unknown function (DUF4389)
MVEPPAPVEPPPPPAEPPPSAGDAYPATLSVDYPDRDLDRVSTGFRIFTVIPIAIVLATLARAAILFISVLLMLVFRRKYPRWWYDWNLQWTRFASRVVAYLLLLDDRYPSTDEEQYVHIEFPYPDAERDVSQFMPLVKWLLAIPHLIVLFFLTIGAIFAAIFAWFAIVFTGRYPRGFFDYVEGVLRWHLRVQAYAFILVTDQYPPFRLRP